VSAPPALATGGITFALVLLMMTLAPLVYPMVEIISTAVQ
jgi:hypothetical protein